MTLGPSGIYKITNTYNGKIYIGQSQNVFERRKQHFNELYRGKHPNKEMQKDWNKYKQYFRWDFIEYCGLKSLNEREKYWIDKLNTLKEGYNLDWVPYKRKEKKKKEYRMKGYHRSR